MAKKEDDDVEARQASLAVNHQIAVIKEAIAAIKTTHNRIGGPHILKKYMGDALATAELLQAQLHNALRILDAKEGRFR